MRIVTLMILLMSLITNSFAQTATTLNKGDTTPFRGVLITEIQLKKYDKEEKANIVLKDLRITQDELIEYHKADAKTQRKKLSEAKFDSYTMNLGMFALGVILTGFAFKVNQKIGDI